MRTRRISCVVLLALLLAGCSFVAKVHYNAEGASLAEPQRTGEDADLLGVAISGGGSRAALFGAAGLEALWEHGLVDRVDYLSSVSGGSIAASWFVKVHGLDHAPIDEEFFERFRAQMRHDYWAGAEWRQMYKLRCFSASRLSRSLGEVLDRQFLDGLTLGALERARPQLLVNATSYDTGRRFIFTTLARDEVQLDYGAVAGAAQALASIPAVQPVTFADPEVLGAVPRDFPVSLAVAASAAAPVVMGPVTIQVGTTYWHLGDGGLYDNSGVETLEQVVLRKLQLSKSPARALIVALDSGFVEDPDSLAHSRRFRISSHPSLLVDIPTARAEAYRHAVWPDVEASGVRRLVLRHTSVRLDPARLPESCSKEKDLCRESDCAAAIATRIARIPTRLQIGACDADLIELAAHAAVHESLSAQHPATRPCRFER